VTVADVAGGRRPRLDAFLAARLPDASRARLAAAVKAGGVSVNGAAAGRASAPLKPGDRVVVAPLPPPPPLRATPEALPLDIVYEDEHLIVVNKEAGVVVHPAPGARGGTLVAALLHHVGATGYEDDAGVDVVDPAAWDEEGEDGEGESGDAATPSPSPFPTPAPLLTPAGVRPGIVHRLDKGTSGLLVVAKTAAAHAGLAEQFRARTVRRVYWALHAGAPRAAAGTIETNIARHAKDRTRMEATPHLSTRGRVAVSRHATLEILAAGGASLVEWRLATGRTHQIRVHARHAGVPILGDGAYGGTGAAAAHALASTADGAARRSSGGAVPRAAVAAAERLVASVGRPALHARLLGFAHPATGEELTFDRGPPPDFEAALAALRAWGDAS
jgi:tRNA pseudouridine synthase 2